MKSTSENRPRNCKSCQFLAKTMYFHHGDQATEAWTEQELSAESLKNDDFTAHCYKQVWRIAGGGDSGEAIKRIVNITRNKNECFYYPRSDIGTSFEAAAELERRVYGQRVEGKRFRYAIAVGVLAAVASALAVTLLPSAFQWVASLFGR